MYAFDFDECAERGFEFVPPSVCLRMQMHGFFAIRNTRARGGDGSETFSESGRVYKC